MNPETGELSWDPNFTGVATIRVREISCGTASDWKEETVSIVVTGSTALNPPFAPNIAIPGSQTTTGKFPLAKLLHTATTRFYQCLWQQSQLVPTNVNPGGGLLMSRSQG